MVAPTSEVEEIYRRMAVIRRESHSKVSESVAGAEAVVDWGRYAWMYPWMALGGAALTGYLLYAATRPKASVAARNPAEEEKQQPSTAEASPKQDRSGTLPNILFAVGGVIVPVAISAAQSYALRWLERQYPTRPEVDPVPPRPPADRGR